MHSWIADAFDLARLMFPESPPPPKLILGVETSALLRCEVTGLSLMLLARMLLVQDTSEPPLRLSDSDELKRERLNGRSILRVEGKNAENSAIPPFLSFIFGHETHKNHGPGHSEYFDVLGIRQLQPTLRFRHCDLHAFVSFFFNAI